MTGSDTVDADGSSQSTPVSAEDAASAGTEDAETEGAVTVDAIGAEDPDEIGETALAASEAFGRLGNETRLRVIRALADADDPPTFTDLYEATDEGTTAGFAYHLRQLVDHYVEKDEGTERYRLTYAGRQVARALRAGTYTRRIDGDPIAIDGDCPVCGAGRLEARAADNHVAVACTDCDTGLLTLPFPPGGARGRSPEALLDAFDAHHRGRLALVAEGVCPDCAGRATARIERAAPERVPDVGADGGGGGGGGGNESRDGDENPDGPIRPVLVADCADCAFGVRAPVTLGVVEHPAAVAFYHDHGENLRDRPVWNLGSEWRERVLSTDPWCVRVTTRLDGEELGLLVGDGPTVVDAERRAVGDAEREGRAEN